MATTKITDLTAYTDPISTDVVPIVDVTSDVTKKVSIADLMENAGSGTEGAPGISFDGDPNTGIYRPGADSVAITTGGTARFTATTTALTAAIPVDVLLGSASTPSYTFTGDTNTGIYSPGADQLAVATNGGERLRITSNGELDVPGGIGPQIRFENQHSVTTDAAISTFDDASGTLLCLGSNFYFNSSGSETRYNTSEESAAVVLNRTGIIDFLTGDTSLTATSRMRITSAGLVGIGTSSPQSPLHIVTSNNNPILAESTTANSNIIFNDVNTTANVTAGCVGNDFRIQAGNLERLRILSTGNVGIGSTTVNEKLTVADSGSANVYIALQNSTTGTTSADGWYVGAAGTEFQIYGKENGPITFSPNSTERARIDSSGRLLVGTSTARSVAGVTGGFHLTGTGADSCLNVSRYSANTGPAILQFGKSRGTSDGSYTIVSENDQLGSIAFAGADGTDLNSVAATITAFVDGTPGTNDMPGRLVFSTTADGASSPTERMRITQAGEIYINRTTRDSVVGSGCKFQLECTGAEWAAVIRNSNANPYGLRLVHDTDKNNTSNAFLQCLGTLAQRAAIRTNGGLANYQSNNVDLSDERTKRDVSSVSSTWNCVQAWDVVNYNYLDDAANDTARIGVIAQQVQQHCPEVVIPYQEAEDAVLDDDGNVVIPAKEERLGVREQQMMWMAIKALQEAQTRIETLEAEVAALKGA